MSCSLPRRMALLACLAIVTAGCFPTRPAYLNDTGDLSYYLDRATAVEYPDVHTATLDEVTQSRAPITIVNPSFDSFWDLTLEEAVSIALQNSKVIRGYGTPALQGGRVAPGIDNLSSGPAGVGTTYNVAIRESEPGIIGTPGQMPSPSFVNTNTSLDANQGVEAALADFDAHWTSSVFWDKSDSPRNNTAVERVSVFQQDAVNLQTQLSKRTADGTQLFVRSTSSYLDNNIPLAPGGFQALRSVWQTALEAEVRQPLLRGRGALINRMPVVIARIGADQEIANLESQLQNMVANVEIRYWEVYCAYRNLDAAKVSRDSALETWRHVQNRLETEAETVQNEAQAREQYFAFRAEVERSWAELLDAESNLRWLLGIASTDGRLIRPIDEPLKAPIQFDYAQALDEAITCRPELRQERWEIKKRQLALAYAKNSLLPSVNAVALYRWLGVGDRLVDYNDPSAPFPEPTSGAWNELLGGDYQEFRVGVEAGIPVGFRRELANVKNAELKLAREIARAEDMELDVTRELQQALRALDTHFQLAQTNFNRWASATTEIESLPIEEVLKEGWLDRYLEALRRRAQAEVAYFQSLCEFNKVIALIHRRKGTSLAYCGIQFDEGPWAGKAYYDASEYARKRGASRQMNYGWSRPDVISRGPGNGDCSSCAVGTTPSTVDGFFHGPGEIIYEGEMFEDYGPGVELSPPGEALEELPEAEPRQLPEPRPVEPNSSQPAPQNPAMPSGTLDPATTLRSPLRTPILRSLESPATAGASVARIKWGTEEPNGSKPSGPQAEATVRLVNHIE